MSETIHDPLAASASTWRSTPMSDRLDDVLDAPTASRLGARWRQTWDRFARRRALAEEVAAEQVRPTRGLPVASLAEAARYVGTVLRQRPGKVALLLALAVVATLAAIVVPREVGHLLDLAVAGTLTRADVTSSGLFLVGALAVSVVVKVAADGFAEQVGHEVVAQVREDAVEAVTELPLGHIEQASTGDLVTRVSRDTSVLANAVGWALPQGLMSSVTIVLTAVAIVANSPVLAIPSLVSTVILLLVGAHYLRRAAAAGLWQGHTASRGNSTLVESAENARIIEALGLQDRRRRRIFADYEHWGQAERYVLSLRLRLWMIADFNSYGPATIVVFLALWAVPAGWATLGQTAAAILFCQQLARPLEFHVHALEEIQKALISVGRLLGIGRVEAEREALERLPVDNRLTGTDVRFAYRPGVDVLHGVDVDLRPGERLAIVGPTGSGKSTLGRLLAGFHRPRTGSVTVGGVPLTELPIPVLRGEVALVTQEHHVFAGTLRENLVLAKADATDVDVEQALRTVDATWVDALSDGLDTQLGKGALELTPSQAQQVALARLLLLNPHTLVLDEATSLIDPRTARHLEASMSALLGDRTVVAIAHRLHTAHDADRIAVVIDGRIVELGSHDELLAAGGEYAALWTAWTS